VSDNANKFREVILRDLGWDPGEIRITPKKGNGPARRFSTNGNPSDTTGWYRFYGNSGVYGNYRDETKTSRKWYVKGIAPEELKHIEEEGKAEAAAQEDAYLVIAAQIRTKYNALKFRTSSSHPYLESKNIVIPGGVALDNGDLIIPLSNFKGQIINAQRIPNELGKAKTFWVSGGDPRGIYIFGTITDKVIIAEGFATAATLHETLGLPVVAAMTAHRLIDVTRGIRRKYKNAEIIIATDDDVSSNNIGEAKARIAAKKSAAKISLPIFDREVVGSDKSVSDWNDWARIYGKDNVKEAFFKNLKDPSAEHTAENLRALDNLPIADPEADEITRLNSRYFFSFEGGKSFVYEERYDRVTESCELIRYKVDDFRKAYCNRFIFVEGKQRELGDAWLHSPRRRQFLGGVVFKPYNVDDPTQYNLFRGFLEPNPAGDWTLLRKHLLDNICRGSTGLYEYLMDWMARLFQYPWLKGEVCIVMRGLEGVGKGILANAIKRICGRHGMAVTHSEQLVGKFNYHLKDMVFVFADEAFYAGDKKHTSVLKSLITEPSIPIEGKMMHVESVDNYLHLMMASNEDWVVPAGKDARRFFVLDVGDAKKQDSNYFNAIQKQLENGGYGAMLAELLARDISNFDVRRYPETEALNTQKNFSMPVVQSWWYTVLSRGYVYESDHGTYVFSQWHKKFSIQLTYKSYLKYATSQKEFRPLSDGALGKALREMCESVTAKAETHLLVSETRDKDGKGCPVFEPRQKRGYTFAGIKQLREEFEKFMGRKFNWELPDIEVIEYVPDTAREEQDAREYERQDANTRERDEELPF
jgi:phage/plasmid primase-like uncharacterized protein